MKLIPYLLTTVLLFSLGSSCKKEKTDPPPPACVAGTGGDINFTFRLEHHGNLIPNDSNFADTVFVKFNATNWSGAPAGANAQFVGNVGEDHIHAHNLTCGEYVFYAIGWDASISDTVTGGLYYKADGTNKNIELVIPVTE